jgi:hypothetical protein
MKTDLRFSSFDYVVPSGTWFKPRIYFYRYAVPSGTWLGKE